jgi:hypothetical protein
MPKIFYWATGDHVAAGGEKHSYEHVDLLNDMGFEAYALHLRGHRYTWFSNTTRTIEGGEFWNLFEPREDYLVLPETVGEMVSGFPGRKVIFNKNLYHGCTAFDLGKAPESYPYTDPDVAAVFAVSDHNVAHLRFAFPSARVFRMYARIDPSIYRYRPLREKKPRIAVTMKAKEPLAVLFTLLQARRLAGLNDLSRFQVTFLHGLSNADTAAVLSESLMLVSLSTAEGLPRTVLEAMLSGCVVAAYGTGPLKEIVPAEYAFEPDDFVSIAEHIERVTRDFSRDLERWTPSVERARSIAAAFTLERQRKHLADAWNEILASQPLCAP